MIKNILYYTLVDDLVYFLNYENKGIFLYNLTSKQLTNWLEPKYNICTNLYVEGNKLLFSFSVEKSVYKTLIFNLDTKEIVTSFGSIIDYCLNNKVYLYKEVNSNNLHQLMI